MWLAPAAAVAGPLEDGAAALNQGNYSAALQLWLPLAQQGDNTARQLIAEMYEKGIGVPQNYAEAARWYRMAADEGDASAQHSLGTLYWHGRGVPQDYVLAHMWFNLSAARWEAFVFPTAALREYARKAREYAIKSRDRVAALMTVAQIAEAQKLAREWRPTR
jgi:hypothetical protein